MAAKKDENLRLVIAGRPKGSEDYWSGLLGKINRSTARGKMILKIEYVPDAETELYFKAADVLVLPYMHIYQSGVLLLGYGFGLPGHRGRRGFAEGGNHRRQDGLCVQGERFTGSGKNNPKVFFQRFI